jgi:hypothetical protein
MPDSLIIADGHVHFHECFDIGRLLDKAWKNFQLAAGRSFVGLLFLTDIKSNGWFLTFRKGMASSTREGKPIGPWKIQPTLEDCSLTAHLNSRETFLS